MQQYYLQNGIIDWE